MAPHTSNWDFLIGTALCPELRNIKCNFLMKKEWFFWPLGPIFRKMGGIPVWRSKHTSMTDNLAAEADKRKAFGLLHYARRYPLAQPGMEKGILFHSPQGASAYPISMGVDYQKKVIQCTKHYHPFRRCGERHARIKLYFKDFKGKKPEKFTIGNIHDKQKGGCVRSPDNGNRGRAESPKVQSSTRPKGRALEPRACLGNSSSWQGAL